MVCGVFSRRQIADQVDRDGPRYLLPRSSERPAWMSYPFLSAFALAVAVRNAGQRPRYEPDKLAAVAQLTCVRRGRRLIATCQPDRISKSSALSAPIRR
jgi:hypothetical protein